MTTPYFSERELGPKPRVSGDIPASVWGGIIALIKSRIANGAFGYRYPLNCPNGCGPYASDTKAFSLALKAEIPEIEWPLDSDEVPPTLAILDLLEFCYRSVGKPVEDGYHSFFNHTHLRFDVSEGRADFCEEINRILARNGLVYNLNAEGLVVRLPRSFCEKLLRRRSF